MSELAFIVATVAAVIGLAAIALAVVGLRIARKSRRQVVVAVAALDEATKRISRL